jgi:glycosyltransferase involved in cell wall biosynthesis
MNKAQPKLKFSIIMAVTVSKIYAGAAKNRPEKLHRAIKSVLAQKYCNWELLVVCDGCREAFNIATEYAKIDKLKRIKVFLLHESPVWSGRMRNYGKFRATGDYVCYLDADDYFGEYHLTKIHKGLTADVIETVDWAWFNDYQYNPLKQTWYENFCYIDKMGKCGTSNIVYKRELEIVWPMSAAYAFDDFAVIAQLRRLYSTSFYRIITPEYYVCHVPKNVYNRGYDI